MRLTVLLLTLISMNVLAEQQPSCEPDLNARKEQTSFNHYTGPNETCIYSKMNPEPAITNNTQSTLACFTSDSMSQMYDYPESIHVWLVDPISCKVIATEGKCLTCSSDDFEDHADYYDEDDDDSDYDGYGWGF